jgi:hypothetical protein
MKAMRFDERLASFADRPDECWPWPGAVNNWGYGYTTVGDGTARGRNVMVHREAYARLVGPIPEGMQIDHLCRNRLCMNPRHLEPVTIAENVLRGAGPGAINRRKTHCYRGHEFTPENTFYVGREKKERRCKVCDREKQRRNYWKDPEKARARVREYWHSERRHSRAS